MPSISGLSSLNALLAHATMPRRIGLQGFHPSAPAQHTRPAREATTATLDRVELSPAARAFQAEQASRVAPQDNAPPATPDPRAAPPAPTPATAPATSDPRAPENESQPSADPTAERGADGEPLDESEQEQLVELKQRDQEVRRHEEAHLAAAGQYASGGPTYEYQTGPDGRDYAIGGEVQIDSAPVKGDPEATIQKMQQVRAAALAPAEPSAQDRRIAAKAQAQLVEAQAELAQQRSPDSAPHESARGTANAEAEQSATTSITNAAAEADSAANNTDARRPTNAAPAFSGYERLTASAARGQRVDAYA